MCILKTNLIISKITKQNYLIQLINPIICSMKTWERKWGINDHKSLIVPKELETIVLSTKSWDIIFFLFSIFFLIYPHYLNNHASYWLCSSFSWNFWLSSLSCRVHSLPVSFFRSRLGRGAISGLGVLLRILLIKIVLMM